jgi:hypothetical protein
MPKAELTPQEREEAAAFMLQKRARDARAARTAKALKEAEKLQRQRQLESLEKRHREEVLQRVEESREAAAEAEERGLVGAVAAGDARAWGEHADAAREWTGWLRAPDEMRAHVPLIDGLVAQAREDGVRHVLVDLPSLDREDDGGLLAAHRAFFDLPVGVGASDVEVDMEPPPRTVTELIAVDDDVAAGLYALFLQVAPILADAVPSRPLLAPVRLATGAAS